MLTPWNLFWSTAAAYVLLIAILFLKGDNDHPAAWPLYAVAVAGGFSLAYLLSFLSVFCAQLAAPQGQVQDKEELKSFEDSMRTKAAFCNVTFGFPGTGAPLS